MRQFDLAPIVLGLAIVLASAMAPNDDHASPDLKLTPGAVNPDVTQSNISNTICKADWTKTIRPPSAYTSRLKRKQLNDPAYGYTDRKMADYEEDHLISLELGGAPRDPKNLWPQPRFGTWTASDKDQLENALHRKVCAGEVPLAIAQHTIALNWTQAYRQYVRE